MELERKTLLPGLMLCASCVALFGMFLAGRSAWQARASRRIAPHEVTLSNVAAFEKQLLADLPPGTPKREVESYLTQWNIRHSYADEVYGIGGNTFYGTIENIGTWRGLFEASLAILIHLDADDRVKSIESQIVYWHAEAALPLHPDFIEG